MLRIPFNYNAQLTLPLFIWIFLSCLIGLMPSSQNRILYTEMFFCTSVVKQLSHYYDSAFSLSSIEMFHWVGKHPPNLQISPLPHIPSTIHSLNSPLYIQAGTHQFCSALALNACKISVLLCTVWMDLLYSYRAVHTAWRLESIWRPCCHGNAPVRYAIGFIYLNWQAKIFLKENKLIYLL